MFNKKTIAAVTGAITIGIGLTAVGLFSSMESQSEITEDTDTTTKITGKYAEAVCDVIGISCPENAEFDGSVGANGAVEYKYADKKSIIFSKYQTDSWNLWGKNSLMGSGKL